MLDSRDAFREAKRPEPPNGWKASSRAAHFDSHNHASKEPAHHSIKARMRCSILTAVRGSSFWPAAVAGGSVDLVVRRFLGFVVTKPGLGERKSGYEA